MPTLVLVPGLLSDAYVWTALARAAETQVPTCHADLTECRDIGDMAKTLLSQSPGALIVVGHSMGGRIALEMARRAPERVVGLVLANTGHNSKRAGEEIKRQAMIEMGHRSMEELADQWLPPMLNPETPAEPQLLAELRAMVLRADADMHERQIRALLSRPDASQYFAEITCPTLLLVGRQDGWSPIKQHHEIANEINGSKLFIVEDAGHFAPVEQSDAVTTAITDWLHEIFSIFSQD